MTSETSIYHIFADIRNSAINILLFVSTSVDAIPANESVMKSFSETAFFKVILQFCTTKKFKLQKHSAQLHSNRTDAICSFNVFAKRNWQLGNIGHRIKILK